MSRSRTRAWISLAAILAGAALAPEVSAGAVTTRIEPRPYYGAVVTIEQGVRVWRPLPPTDRVIINPGNKAKITFNFNSGHGGGGAADHDGSTDAPPAPVAHGYGGGYGGYFFAAPGYRGGQYQHRNHLRLAPHGRSLGTFTTIRPHAGGPRPMQPHAGMKLRFAPAFAPSRMAKPMHHR